MSRIGQAIKNISITRDLDPRYVNVSGDTMTGDLTLNGGNIVMTGAETVDGVDISALVATTLPATYLKLDASNQSSWTPTTTVITNLNADLLDGNHLSDITTTYDSRYLKLDGTNVLATLPLNTTLSAVDFRGYGGVPVTLGAGLKSPWTRSVIVDQGGKGDYTTIKDACDYVATQTRSASAPWLVIVKPAIYAESAFTVPTFTTVVGEFSSLSNVQSPVTINMSAVTSGAGITVSNGSSLKNVNVYYFRTSGFVGQISLIYFSSNSSTTSLDDMFVYVLCGSCNVDIYGIHSVGSSNSTLLKNVLFDTNRATGSGTFYWMYQNGSGNMFAQNVGFMSKARTSKGAYCGAGTLRLIGCNINVANTAIEHVGGTVEVQGTTYTSSTGTITHLDRLVKNDNEATYQSSASTQITRIFKGAASQSVDLTQWQNSSGTVLASVGPTGSITIQGGNQAGGTMPKFTQLDGSGNITFQVNEYGTMSSFAPSVSSSMWLLFGGGVVGDTYGRVGFVSNQGVPTVAMGPGNAARDSFIARNTAQGFVITTTATTGIPLTLKGASSQSANLTEWQNSNGTALSYVDATGGALFGDKVRFTQTDGNEYIDSLADGYMDYRATTAHRFGDGTNYTSISNTGVISFTGTAGIDLPHMMQSDSTDQAIANVNNAQVITFDTDVHHDNITRTSSSRFTITKAGSYLITFSGVALSGVAGKVMNVWLRVNGNDVANSNTIYTFKAANANAVIAVSFIEHFAVNDYFEFWCWGDDTGVKWDATAAGTSPTRPACPSIIITANYVAAD